MTTTVWVAAFRPDLKHPAPGGTGGFQWHQDIDIARREYQSFWNMAHEGTEGYEVVFFKHKTNAEGSAITDEIEAQLDELMDDAIANGAIP